MDEKMLPEETTEQTPDEAAFVALLKRAECAPPSLAVPSALSERIAAATYARPSIWERLSQVLRPAPARYALAGALAAGTVSAVFLPRLPKPEGVRVPVAAVTPPTTNTVNPTPAPRADEEPKTVSAPRDPAPVSATLPTPSVRDVSAPGAAVDVAPRKKDPVVPTNVPPTKVLPTAKPLTDTSSGRRATLATNAERSVSVPSVASTAKVPVAVATPDRAEVSHSTVAARTAEPTVEPSPAPPAPAVTRARTVVASYRPHVEAALSATSEPEAEPSATPEQDTATQSLRGMLRREVGSQLTKEATAVRSFSGRRGTEGARGTDNKLPFITGPVD